MKSLARLLILIGAGGVALAAVVPWVRVEPALPIQLDFLSVDVPAAGKTVSGTDTVAWPFLIGVAGLIGALVLLNKARKLIMLLGGLVVAAGGGLFYYLNDAVDFATRGEDVRSQIENLAARNVLTDDPRIGPYLLIGSGLLILIGAARAFD